MWDKNAASGLLGNRGAPVSQAIAARLQYRSSGEHIGSLHAFEHGAAGRLEWFWSTKLGKKRRRSEKEDPPPPLDGAYFTPEDTSPSGWLRLAVAVAVVALAVVAWVDWGKVGAPQARDPRLSVLLVSVDTLRADALGAYGNSRAKTPWMDRLAKGGVRFDAAHSHNVVTLPSHVNMLTGRLPFEHGVRDNNGFRVPRDLPTLATLLKPTGHRSAGFVSAFVLDERFGLATGFERWDARVAGGEWGRGFGMPERPGTATVREAQRWLASISGPSFAFVHLYEPHAPYAPPPELASGAASAYHGEVAAADAALEPLLRPVIEKGRSGSTIVILTSDHGESLGEHGEATHGLFAYEATLRVPLVVYAPALFGSRVVKEPVRHVDLVPTVLELLGQQPPPGLAGRSLVPLLEGGGLGSLFGGSSPPAPDTYFEALSASINRRWAPLYGLREGTLKYVELPLPELYDLAADPGETTNLAASRPADLDRLAARLAALRAADTGVKPAPESPETLERLRALGYVAAARAAPPKERYTEDDDPKRLVALDAKTNQMLSLFHEGRLDEAIGVGREVIRARPDMDLAHLQLAYLERERGNLRGAIASAQRAVELRPGDAESSALLGVYLTEAGRAREAAAFLAPWLKRGTDDLDVLNALGIALSSSGRAKEALSVLDRARRAHPTNTQVLVNIGTVNLMAGAVDQARTAFEAALELDPEVARAHNSLGVIAARQGRSQEALERWKRAAELNPADYQSLYNIGTRLWDAGRRGEARPYLEAYLRVAPRALEGRDMERVGRMLAGQRGR